MRIFPIMGISVVMGIKQTLVTWHSDTVPTQPLQARLNRVETGGVTMTHYHFRWSGSAQLDWERFNTPAEAEASAKQLLRHGETYMIEEHDRTCSRCRAARNLRVDPRRFSQAGT